MILENVCKFEEFAPIMRDCQHVKTDQNKTLKIKFELKDLLYFAVLIKQLCLA
jgi:hypothetical protein